MSTKLNEIDKEIEKLTNSRNQLLYQIKTGMVIRFPGRDVIFNTARTESDSADGCHIDPDPKRLRELVFVNEQGDGTVTLLSMCGMRANFGTIYRSSMPRESVLFLIEKHNGQILSKDISDILNKF